MLRPAHCMGRIDGDDLPDYHPVEKHPKCRKPQLHRGPGVQPELHLNKRGHVDRLHMGEIPNAMLGTKGRELPDGLAVGATCVGVADMGAEEIAHPRPGIRSRCEDRGQGSARDRDLCHFSDSGNAMNERNRLPSCERVQA